MTDPLQTILVGLAAFIIGLVVDRFLPSYFSKKGENLATKEDIGKITSEIESVKNIFKDQYDLSKVEKEFYNEMAKNIYKFIAEIKKYEFEHGVNSATKKIILADPIFREKYFEFINSANEFIGKSYIFLKEESYQHLKEAMNIEGSFADLTNNLLYAMRKSLHPNTGLKPRESLKEFKY